MEPVLELLAVLRFPCLDEETVLLLDLVPVPLWDDVERAGGDDPQVGCQVVDVAALEPFLVLIIRIFMDRKRKRDGISRQQYLSLPKVGSSEKKARGKSRIYRRSRRIFRTLIPTITLRALSRKLGLGRNRH